MTAHTSSGGKTGASVRAGEFELRLLMDGSGIGMSGMSG
jgi:hypothetical protein